jgi:hypothetical protein
MKVNNVKNGFLYAVLLLLPLAINAQDCEVKMKTINKTYKGDCKKGKANGQGEAKGVDTYVGEFKKGLPHGKGTYTWSKEQKTFDGFWEKGKMNGEGTMTFLKNDSIITGFWSKNKYIGKYKKPYVVGQKSNLITNTFINNNDQNLNAIRFYITFNNTKVNKPNVTFVIKEGNYQQLNVLDEFTLLENVTFPFKARVNYNREFFDLEIYQPGLWFVNVSIEEIRGFD